MQIRKCEKKNIIGNVLICSQPLNESMRLSGSEIVCRAMRCDVDLQHAL